MTVFDILVTAIQQIDPADARREVQATDEQLAARLSELTGVQVSPRADFVRLTRLALQLAATR